MALCPTTRGHSGPQGVGPLSEAPTVGEQGPDRGTCLLCPHHGPAPPCAHHVPRTWSPIGPTFLPPAPTDKGLPCCTLLPRPADRVTGCRLWGASATPQGMAGWGPYCLSLLTPGWAEGHATSPSAARGTCSSPWPFRGGRAVPPQNSQGGGQLGADKGDLSPQSAK